MGSWTLTGRASNRQIFVGAHLNKMLQGMEVIQ